MEKKPKSVAEMFCGFVAQADKIGIGYEIAQACGEVVKRGYGHFIIIPDGRSTPVLQQALNALKAEVRNQTRMNLEQERVVSRFLDGLRV